jgi:GNAT superfamily N-acetyltransferase
MDLHAVAMRHGALDDAPHERLREHWGLGMFRVLLAGCPAVGFALVYAAYSSFMARPTLYWEDGYVEESWRDTGIGGRMYQMIIEYARECGAGALVFSVQDWNTGVMRFHERHGAVKQVGRSAFKLALGGP